MHDDSCGNSVRKTHRVKPCANGSPRQRNPSAGRNLATRKAIDYNLGRWAALTRYIDDGDLPIDNKQVENRIRPVALGRNNWLFAGSPAPGSAPPCMSLVQSAKLNGHDPYHYLERSRWSVCRPSLASRLSKTCFRIDETFARSEKLDRNALNPQKRGFGAMLAPLRLPLCHKRDRHRQGIGKLITNEPIELRQGRVC